MADGRTDGTVGPKGAAGSLAADDNDKCPDQTIENAICLQESHQGAVRPEHQSPKAQVHMSDLLGEYGSYQLFLSLVTFLRYVCLAMMTNTGPLIAPELPFWCQLPNGLSLEALLDFNSTHVDPRDTLLRGKCHLRLANGSRIACTQWTFDQTRTGVTLTDAYGLVCDRDWLRSAFQSSISIGIAAAAVVFGAASDEHGRRMVIRVSMVVALLAGLASYCAPNYLTYTLARSLCSMCDLCMAGSLFTIIVEVLGSKYRGPVCLVVTTGWSIGVMVMPWVTGYFGDFRNMMLFLVSCHVVTVPCMLAVGESPRWLLVNGKIDEAQQEVRRICGAWNCRSKSEMGAIDEKFEKLKVRYIKRQADEAVRLDGLVQKLTRTFLGGFTRVDQIFKSRNLTITTLVFIWITFNSELLYMILIFFNSDHEDNMKLNYAIGGLMEMLATLIGIVMISSLTRRVSLSLILTTISVLMLGLAFTHGHPAISIYSLNLTKLAGSVLTSLVFVIITELFPTNLRQTGAGLTSTLGSVGAILAPFIHNELTALIGFKYVLLLLCISPLTAAALVPFLRETKGVELADDIDEID